MDDKNKFEFAEKTKEEKSVLIESVSNKKYILNIVFIVIISLLLPMIGFAVFMKWRETRPSDAKYPLYATIVSVVFGYSLLIYWIFFI